MLITSGVGKDDAWLPRRAHANRHCNESTRIVDERDRVSTRGVAAGGNRPSLPNVRDFLRREGDGWQMRERIERRTRHRFTLTERLERYRVSDVERPAS